MPRLRPPPEKPAEKPPETEDGELKLAPEPEVGEPEVIVEEEKEQPDKTAELALKKQIEDLRKSEELQRTYAAQLKEEREKAMKLAQEHAEKLREYQKTAYDQERLAVDSTLAAAKAEAEKAQQDIETAGANGDYKAQAEAYRRLARAESNLAVLERGKDDLRAQRKELKKERKQLKQQQKELQQQPPPVSLDDRIDSFGLPLAETNWLKGHHEYMTDKRKAAALSHAHALAEIEGLKPGNPEYLPYIERELDVLSAVRQNGAPPKVETEDQQQRASIMSAPVSRQGNAGTGRPSSPTRITLTAQQKEAAQMAGVTEAEYAKQLIKLNELKAQGIYGEQR